MTNASSDIFISYAHNDNRGSNWVTAFVRQLGFALTRRLGRTPRIFFDDGQLTGNESEAVFEREAAAARLFVPILSPSFVQSAWPGRELAAFLASSENSLDFIYPVELLPLFEAQVPVTLRQKIRKHRFWQRNPDAGFDVDVQLDPIADLRAFNLRVEELSARLCGHLQQLDANPPEGPLALVPPTAFMHASGPKQPVQADTSAGPRQDVGLEPAVFLGQVTIDLEDEALRLRQYLEQFGFRVLPDDTLPQGGEDFALAVAEGLAGCHLFVQLLGPHGDRRPKDLPEGYTAFQVDCARKAGVPIMLWCRPDLSQDIREAHRDAALFASVDLVACGIEEFKSSVVDRMKRLLKPIPQRTHGDAAVSRQIFIDSDRVDIDLARAIAGDLQQRSASVYLPVFEGSPEDIARDLKESLAECSGVVIVFGAAPATWVRARLRFVGRAGYENPGAATKVIAVYLHPPRRQDELGVMSPNIVWVDGQRAGPADALSNAFIGRAP